MSTAAETLGLVNHAAETDVIVGMLESDELALSLVQQINDNEFYDPRRRVVFAAIRSLLRGIEPVNRENILAECRAQVLELFGKKSTVVVTAEFLDSLKGKPAEAVRAAITVHRLAWLREAGNYAEWLVKALQMNPDPNELYTEAQGRWQLLAPAKKAGATLYGWETINLTREMQTERRQDAESGLSQRFNWPWASWNQWVRPLRAGLVGVLAAPDGVGKSTYLEWIAEHWAKNGNRVVFVHLEDDHKYKLDRRTSRHAALSIEVVESGIYTREQQRSVDEADDRIGEWAEFLHYTHAPGWSMSDIIKELQKLVDEGQCEAVVLDYIDKCESDRRQLKLYGDDQYLREGDNMNMLKNFAEKAGIPVFTATQGNKNMQAEGVVQTRRNIQGSGQKSQRAQLVMILTRDIVKAGGLWDGTTKLADEGDYSPIATLRIDKQNRGATKTFYQVFRGECYRIGDPPQGFDINKLN